MALSWGLISEAPLHVQRAARHYKAEIGKGRHRLFLEEIKVDGRLALQTWVLWTGPIHGNPVTHYLREPIPEVEE